MSYKQWLTQCTLELYSSEPSQQSVLHITHQPIFILIVKNVNN